MENEAWLCVAAASPRAAERGDGVLSGVWREEEKCGGINATAFLSATDSTKQTGRFTNLGVGSGGGEIKGQGVWLSRG